MCLQAGDLLVQPLTRQRTPWRAELCALVAIAAPNALTAAARSGLDLSNTAVLGRLRTADGKTTALYLDAASLAALWVNLTIASLGRGCGGATAVLTSQAFGAGNMRLVGTWLLTGLLFFTAAAVVLIGLWGVSPFLLGAAVHDHDAAALAGRYAQLSMPSALPAMWMWALAAWLIAQRMAFPEVGRRQHRPCRAQLAPHLPRLV